MNSKLPAQFNERMRNQLGEYWESFQKALLEPAPVSIRYNPKKNHSVISTEQIPWCELGVFMYQRPIFTLDPDFHAGAYYVQEASSMLIEQAWRSVNPKNKSVKVLDLCASPGGKSTHLLSLMSEDSLLVSNEVIQNRVPALIDNISKWGYPNVVVTNLDPKFFARLEGFFDIILIDAPCSGEGLFRKDSNSINEWSVENTKNCALRQRRILNDILPALKKEGHLVYSTCTYNPDENITQIESLTEKQGMSCIAIPLDKSWGIQQINSNSAIGYQCMPHLTKGEGFFISVLQNTSGSYKEIRVQKKLSEVFPKNFNPSSWLSNKQNWFIFESFDKEYSFVPESIKSQIEQLISQIPVKKVGTHFVTIKGKDVLPSHLLALSIYKSDSLPFVPLEIENSQEFLRKNNLTIEYPGDGWQMVSYHNNALGWINATSGRLNNKLPKEYRIKNL